MPKKILSVSDRWRQIPFELNGVDHTIEYHLPTGVFHVLDMAGSQVTVGLTDALQVRQLIKKDQLILSIATNPSEE